MTFPWWRGKTSSGKVAIEGLNKTNIATICQGFHFYIFSDYISHVVFVGVTYLAPSTAEYLEVLVWIIAFLHDKLLHV